MAQPNITRVEYYIDADPGYGKGTALPVVAGKDISNLSFNIDLVPLSQGVHFVGVRSKDSNGAWSLDNKWLFLKPLAAGSLVPQPKINFVEYYLDKDPGYGKANPLPVTPAKDLNNLSFVIHMDTLYEGVHLVGVRSKDANGAWSLDNHWVFLKPYKISGPHPQPKLNRVEYYIDADPGYGNGTSLSIKAGQYLNGLSFNIDLTKLTEGVHVAGVRSRDENGAWSHDNHWVFLKSYSKTGTGPQPKITRVEYYVDNDPGYGKATPVSIKPGTDLSELSFLINMTKITNHTHIVGVRSMDSKGAWSLDNRFNFSGGTALPIELIGFVASAEQTGARLAWSTATESNSKQFLVQRSVDGKTFLTIGTVAAAGYSNTTLNYSFMDAQALQFKNQLLYYRLQQLDNDNRFAYSDVRTVRIGGVQNLLRLQVNPVNSQAVLLYTSGENDKITIHLINSLGQVILTRQIPVTAGANQITLATAALAQGVYTIEATSANNRQTVRMMKQ